MQKITCLAWLLFHCYNTTTSKFLVKDNKASQLFSGIIAVPGFRHHVLTKRYISWFNFTSVISLQPKACSKSHMHLQSEFFEYKQK